ncbi:MASE1 domain-containing protein [Streptomyces uncialis]|uniref:Membrane protein n=1 Tax=Streptomyces uncialis TaxID=1048205 RepID=A0A1Q4V9K8_9ACTN|nr:MASE1 domain-containing protein [Streptomyces uncialis]MCX4658231.1 MASE1 domain-containing protein [Streptomyces uncialis]OKH94548.1 membrane protein [Streptomyces uncialis]WTE14853.1 MASE1 domain-containing protein [Streptomyces uncialis]
MTGVVRIQLKGRRAAVLVLANLAVAACYYLGGRLGLLKALVVEGSVVSPVWPPTGIALAALLLLGPGVWPGIALGALLVVHHLSPSLEPGALAILVGNTLAPFCAYVMLRIVGFRTELDRLRDGFALVFLGALLGMLVSATAGAGQLLLGGSISGGEFWPVWAAWWTGDALGVLVVAPVLLILWRARPPLSLDRWPEALVLAVCAGVVAPFVAYSTLSLLFLVYPLLIWAALRFQLPGATLCALYVSVVTAVSAADGDGPFRDHTRLGVMINLQAFNGAIALTALLLAALVTEQLKTRRHVEEAVAELADVVERLAPGEGPGRRSHGG